MLNEKSNPTFELKEGIIGLIIRIEGHQELINQIINCQAELKVFPVIPYNNNNESMYVVLFDKKDEEKAGKIKKWLLGQGIKMTDIL